MTLARLTRPAAALIAGTLMIGGLSGCSMFEDKGASTTCQQFAEMDDHTGLLGSPNDDQTSVIESMLNAHDKSIDDANVSIAYMKIIAYCNIYEGRSGSHENSTIDNISGLDQ